MINIQFLLPEIFLSISTFALLIIGVFLKNSFELIYRLSIFVIFILILILITGETSIVKIFNDSFIYDKFSIFAKVLILVATFFVLLISKKYLTDIKNNKFEYPILFFFYSRMFIMVSSNINSILFRVRTPIISLVCFSVF